jgi:hypothetical protein
MKSDNDLEKLKVLKERLLSEEDEFPGGTEKRFFLIRYLPNIKALWPRELPLTKNRPYAGALAIISL